MKIAEEDLKSTRVLYDKKLYPQAVFFLQQSVEKTLKSVGLLITPLDEKPLSPISYKISQTEEEALREKTGEFIGIKELLEGIPEIRAGSLIKELNLKRYEETIEATLAEFCRLVKTKDKLISAASKKIGEALDMIVELIEGLAKITETEIKTVEMDETGIDREISEALLPLSIFEPERAEKIEQEWRQQFKSDAGPKLVKAALWLISSNTILYLIYFYLSVLTLPHFSATRYPQGRKTPKLIYTKKSPLIKRLPELMNAHAQMLRIIRQHAEQFSQFLTSISPKAKL